MQHNTNEIAQDAGIHPAVNESAGSTAPLPSEARQSGKRILFNVILYMILVPAAIMILVRLLVE